MSLERRRNTGNRQVYREELHKIRHLEDFDLVMLISEIHDHGWETARKTLSLMPEGQYDIDEE